MMKFRTSRRGISLLEIVIAMQCTALLLVMVCRVLPIARRQMREADQKLGSALICQNVLEEHLPVAIQEWPRERIPVEGQHYAYEIEAIKWNDSQQMMLAQVRLYSGEDEVYRLETGVYQ